MRTCIVCLVEKPADLAHFERAGKSALRHSCRECRKAAKRVVERKPRHKTPAAGRFTGLVDKGGPTDCWPWMGSTNGKPGYGKFTDNDGKQELAHRYAHKLWIGPIPDGMEVCHTCDFKTCCNPGHFFLGTQLQNVHDCRAKNRHDHKLEIPQVLEMRRLRREDKATYVDIGARYGVTPTAARHAVIGQTWGHI